jgi:hypothetical protein
MDRVVVDRLLGLAAGCRCRQGFSAAGGAGVAGVGAAGDLAPDAVAGAELMGGHGQRLAGVGQDDGPPFPRPSRAQAVIDHHLDRLILRAGRALRPPSPAHPGCRA